MCKILGMFYLFFATSATLPIKIIFLDQKSLLCKDAEWSDSWKT
jgi:hypothetical protein